MAKDVGLRPRVMKVAEPGSEPGSPALVPQFSADVPGWVMCLPSCAVLGKLLSFSGPQFLSVGTWRGSLFVKHFTGDLKIFPQSAQQLPEGGITMTPSSQMRKPRHREVK